MDPDQTPSKAQIRLFTLVATRKSYAALLGGQWVSSVGGYAYTVALSWVTLSVTHSDAALGLVGAVGILANTFSVVSGVYVDRWDRRRTMIVTDVIRGLLSAALAVIAILHGLTLWVIVLLVLLARFSGTFFFPAAMALLPTLVEENELPRANSLLDAGRTAAEMVGQALGGALIGLIGPALVFVFNASTFAVSVFSLLFVRPLHPKPQPTSPTAAALKSHPLADFWHQLVAGQAPLWSNPLLRRIVPIGMITGFASVALGTLDVAWIRQVLHLGPLEYGFFVMATAVGASVGSLGSGFALDRHSPRRIAIAMLIILGGLEAILSFTPVYAPDLVIAVLWGGANGLLSTTITTVLMQSVPREVLGRAFGALVTLTTITAPLGALVSGVLATAVSLHFVFLGAGVMIAAPAIGFVGLSDPPRPAHQIPASP